MKGWLEFQSSWFSPKSVLTSLAFKLLVCAYRMCSWAVWPGVCEFVHGEGFSFCPLGFILAVSLPIDKALESIYISFIGYWKQQKHLMVSPPMKKGPCFVPGAPGTVWHNTVVYKRHAQKWYNQFKKKKAHSVLNIFMICIRLHSQLFWEMRSLKATG